MTFNSLVIAALVAVVIAHKLVPNKLLKKGFVQHTTFDGNCTNHANAAVTVSVVWELGACVPSTQKSSKVKKSVLSLQTYKGSATSDLMVQGFSDSKCKKTVGKRVRLWRLQRDQCVDNGFVNNLYMSEVNAYSSTKPEFTGHGLVVAEHSGRTCGGAPPNAHPNAISLYGNGRCTNNTISGSVFTQSMMVDAVNGFVYEYSNEGCTGNANYTPLPGNVNAWNYSQCFDYGDRSSRISIRRPPPPACRDCSTCASDAVITPGVTSIEANAFSGCDSLTSVTIPDSVTTIGDSAFANCGSLTSVMIPDSVTFIGDSAFSNCNSLTSVTIPDSVTSIGDSAFAGCPSLTSVTIPDSVTSIGDAAFANCGSLTSVEIPDSVTSIGNQAFHLCISLTYVTIPDSVTSIGNWAFMSCVSLTSVTLPDSVTSIGVGLFSACASLTTVTIPDCAFDFQIFDNCPLSSVTVANCTSPSVPQCTLWNDLPVQCVA